MGVIGNEGEKAMQKNEDHSAAKRAEKWRAAVYGARQDRGKDNDQDGVECGFARKRAFMTKPNHEQRRQEDDNAAERDLNKGQIFWLNAQAKE